MRFTASKEDQKLQDAWNRGRKLTAKEAKEELQKLILEIKGK